MPEPGRMRIRVLPRGIQLQANRVERARVLRELSRKAVFDLELGALPPHEVTLDLADASMKDVLPVLLAGVAYSSDWAVSHQGVHRLVWLSTGELPDAASAAAGTDPAGAGGRARPEEPGPQARRRIYLRWLAARFREHGFERHSEREEAREEIEAERQRALALQLERGDVDERRAAVAAIDPHGPGVARIAEAARSDTSAEVRRDALDALAESESYEAIGGLIAAASDPDPALAARSLEILAEIGDPTVLSHLPADLASHPDPRVAQAFLRLRDDLE